MNVGSEPTRQLGHRVFTAHLEKLVCPVKDGQDVGGVGHGTAFEDPQAAYPCVGYRHLRALQSAGNALNVGLRVIEDLLLQSLLQLCRLLGRTQWGGLGLVPTGLRAAVPPVEYSHTRQGMKDSLAPVARIAEIRDADFALRLRGLRLALRARDRSRF